MAPIDVHIKHSGKVYDVSLDPDLPPSVFKDAIYQLTGVPPDRMKVMVKGGVLNDDTPWKKVGPKANQTFMVIGAAGPLPQPPQKPIVFLEDMDDTELAEALAKPVGLVNLGNTCYMNATIQALRAIPELQVSLSAGQPSGPLPRALRDLYGTMSRTTERITPLPFLQVLRTVNPQFAEISRNGGGYAQQDAEECYGQIINTLRDLPAPGPPGRSFVDQFLMGEIRRELRCDEAPEEPPTVAVEKVLKIECNISVSTNYMLTGIMNSLDTSVTKFSPTLGRDAVYTQHSRLTRLPAYLTVHMVRFAWRQDIGKKAKIMRKVKFPTEFDALDLVADELKHRLLPISRKLKEIEKERAERRKVRRRTKATPAPGTAAPTPAAATESTDVDMAAPPVTEAAVGAELQPEDTYRATEAQELSMLADAAGVRGDIGSSESGLYDLVAIVTHKGAAADAGHYIGFVKKSVFHGARGEEAEADEDWYKFDDDKVSVFPAARLGTLDGGGEDSSAYVLLYKTKPLS